MRRKLQLAFIIVVLASCATWGSLALAISYRLTELPPLGADTSSWGFAVNAKGEAAGISSEFSFNNVESTGKGGFWRGALFRGSNAASLASLPPHGPLRTVAFGLNDQGVVVGRFGGPAGDARAILNDGTTTQVLSGFEEYLSEARAINNHGQIAGAYSSRGRFAPMNRAFRHDGTTWHDLGTLGGNRSHAYDINDLGYVTGFSLTSSGESHAFFHDGTTMHDLGTLGGSASVGYGISSLGHVTGYVQTGSPDAYLAINAFLYDGTTMHDLGSLDGRWTVGNAVNSHGHVVGHVPIGFNDIYNREGNVAFLYTPGTGMVALSSLVNLPPGWTQLNSARDINDAGQITGYGTKDGYFRGFLLTPVPEPSTAFLAAVVVLFALNRTRF